MCLILSVAAPSTCTTIYLLYHPHKKGVINSSSISFFPTTITISTTPTFFHHLCFLLLFFFGVKFGFLPNNPFYPPYATRLPYPRFCTWHNLCCCYLRSVETPTATLLTSLPLSSNVIGFSTTTVSPRFSTPAACGCEWGPDGSGGGPCGAVAVGGLCCAGNGTRILGMTMDVTYWQSAHFTLCAPYWYMRVIPHPPQLMWANWGPSMAKLTVWQHEHCTLVAPRMYMSSVRHPPHMSCDISVPCGGTWVTELQSAHRTLLAPCGYTSRVRQPLQINCPCCCCCCPPCIA